VDTDCDGANDYDQDGDGYTAEAYGGTDCDDTAIGINPAAFDIAYDGVDSDCDGASDYDFDGDGYDSSAYGGDDCDDYDATVNPGAAEVWYDGDDQDCDGGDDYDQDGDGYDSNDYGGDDCDDTDASAYPGGVEVYYDGVDGDCDGYNDYDADLDGFASDAYGGDDCDDTDPDLHPYRFETTTDGIDNDCDGLTDTADTTASVTSLSGDDASQLVSFRRGFSFNMCGTAYTSAYFQTNGRVTFGTSDTSYSESYTSFQTVKQIAGVWDDLYPSTVGYLTWAQQGADGVSFYWNAVPEYGSTGHTETFAITLLSGGLVYAEWVNVGSTDLIAGFSCGGASANTMIDITDEMANLPYGALGIGNGVEDLEYEQFTTSNDLSGTHAFWCVPDGSADADGDGWTVDCGDTDDSNASVYPY
jgi:hypothetical protein